MKIAYIEKTFKPDTMKMIDQTNSIIGEYRERGMSLTLRQIYYQFVSRDLIPNTLNSYKRLGNIISDARMAGLIDWYSMIDRTRSLYGVHTYDDPGELIRSVRSDFAMDHWKGQEYRPEVWIEKDALAGVISRVCRELQIDYFPCKGYVSQSMMWRSARRMKMDDYNDQIPVIIHLGDHDPSGMDMSRDIQERLSLFGVDMDRAIFHRVALNYDQVEEYGPPPNPAKVTDTRAAGYISQFGNSSWELDALQPEVFDELIRKFALQYRDQSLYEEVIVQEQEYKVELDDFINRWED